jgi:hypothetical protein
MPEKINIHESWINVAARSFPIDKKFRIVIRILEKKTAESKEM